MSSNAHTTTLATQQQQQKQITPGLAALRQASNIAIETDKVIKLDYYADSLRKTCKLVKTQQQETILYKSNDEYTSPISKVFQVENENGGADIVCVSENSVYLIHASVLAK